MVARHNHFEPLLLCTNLDLSWSKTERQNNKQAQARSLSFIMSDWGMGLALLEIAYIV